MSGGGGRVTPASKAANDSGAVNVTVQVFGAGSEKVAASATMDGNNAMIQLAINGATEALRRDVSSNGTTSKLLQQTWALKRTGSCLSHGPTACRHTYADRKSDGWGK